MVIFEQLCKYCISAWFTLESIFYLIYFSMPFLLPLDGTYNHKRVVATQILVFISALCSYGIAIYAVGIAYNMFGWFSLLFLLLINWVLLPLYIISILYAFVNHSFLLLIMTIIATPTIKYYLKSLEIKEILRSKNAN